MAILPTARMSTAEKMLINGDNLSIKSLRPKLRKEDKRKVADLFENIKVDKVRPERLLVMDQFPNPGDDVPLGTKVVLTFVSKGSIKVKDLIQSDVAIYEKFENGRIQDVINLVSNNDEVVRIIEKSNSYDEITETDRIVLDSFVKNELSSATFSIEQKKQTYDNISLIYSF